MPKLRQRRLVHQILHSLLLHPQSPLLRLLLDHLPLPRLPLLRLLLPRLPLLRLLLDHLPLPLHPLPHFLQESPVPSVLHQRLLFLSMHPLPSSIPHDLDTCFRFHQMRSQKRQKILYHQYLTFSLHYPKRCQRKTSNLDRVCFVIPQFLYYRFDPDQFVLSIVQLLREGGRLSAVRLTLLVILLCLCFHYCPYRGVRIV